MVISAKDTASSTLKNIQKDVMAIGAAYLSWQGVKDIIGGSIKAAAENEKAVIRLNNALKQHGYTVADNSTKLKQLAEQLMYLSGIEDEQFLEATKRLIDAGVDMAKMHTALQAAADLSAAKQMDLMSATELLGKANMGVTETLRRYGIVIADNIPKGEAFDAVLKQINERFGGTAATNMEGINGKLQRMGILWGELKEKIGYAFANWDWFIVELKLLGDQLEYINEHGLKEFISKWLDIGSDPESWGKLIARQKEIMANIDATTTKYDKQAIAEYVLTGKLKMHLDALNEEDRTYNIIIPPITKYADLTGQITSSHKQGADALQSLLKQYVEYEQQLGRGADAEAKRKAEADMAYADKYFADVRANLAKQKDAWKEAEQPVIDWAAILKSSTSDAVDNAVGSLEIFRMQAKTIWQQMARDFMQEVVQKIIRATALLFITKLIGGPLSFLGLKPASGGAGSGGAGTSIPARPSAYLEQQSLARRSNIALNNPYLTGRKIVRY